MASILKRRAGLSYRQRPPPLLKHVKGKQRMKEPESVDAPPLPSSDEDEEGNSQDQEASSQHQDSDGEDGRSRRADIHKTFTKSRTAWRESDKADATSQKWDKIPSRRSARQATKDTASKGTKRAMEDIEDDEGVESESSRPAKKTKWKESRPLEDLGGHMDFNRSGKASPMKSPTKKYGKHYVRSQARKLKVIPEKDLPSSPRKELVMPRVLSSESPEKRPPKLLIREGSLSAETTSPTAQRQQKPSRVKTNRSSGSGPKQNPGRRGVKHQTNAFLARQDERGERMKRHLSPEESPEKSEFKMPSGFEDLKDSQHLEAVDMSFKGTAASQARGPHSTVCPMCNKPVDKKLLREFSNNGRMSITQQAEFCRMHNKTSDQETWKSRGYPDIDWDNLESRVKKHHGFLKALIGGKSSYFGGLLSDQIKTGKNRTLFKTDDYLTPGYYGLRGMRAITENIIQNFSSLLRERAPHDRLISARGYTRFVQLVLVPEIAVKFIQEDMSLDAVAARAVMDESRAIGERLNDDKGDIAQGNADDANEDDADVVEEERKASDDKTFANLNSDQVDDSSSELSSLASLDSL